MQLCDVEEYVETQRLSVLLDDMESLEEKCRAGTAVDRTLSSAHGIYRIRKGWIKLWHFGQEDFPKRSTQA